MEDNEKELEHSSLQEKLDREMKELDRRLEQKEAEMKKFAGVDTSVLKQHYEKKVHELEQEKRTLQDEIEQLRNNLANISSNSDGSTQKLKEDYLQKLNLLEAQVAELKKKQDAQAQLLRQKQKSDEAARRLQDEIQRIKTQKVQLQQQIKKESEQFRLWKASREKEVLQLKKEGRRNEYEMHKLLALNQRQKMVLQRKTEEAALATKRLKELLESRKASSREASGNSNGLGVQALMQAIEHELEVTVRVHEVRCEYERQMQERAKMAKEVAELKEEAQMQKQSIISNYTGSLSPGARNSRIFALENMLATSSSALVSMASQLSEAEERERAFSGRGRWNQVRSLPEAKNMMNYLFNLASSSRCRLWDREVDCREKDSEIRSLKEKVVHLIRQMEMQKAELLRQEKLKEVALKNSNKTTASQGYPVLENGSGLTYDLRPKGIRNSMAYGRGENFVEVFEDMDTSESEHLEVDETDDSEWQHSDVDAVEYDSELGTAKKKTSKRQSRKRNSESSSTPNESDMESVENSCCSCTKSSSCKTMKCECRASGSSCCASCGCHPTKCSNRDLVKESQEVMNLGGIDEIEISRALASHGAMLLQTALSEKPNGTKADPASNRKPLSDIGNTLARANLPKPNSQRKKWRKSAIQLVPVPAPSTQPEGAEAVKELERSAVEPPNVPLKLPRAMRSALSNNNNQQPPLRERNLDPQPIDRIPDKEADSAAVPKSPLRLTKATDEKENRGI